MTFQRRAAQRRKGFRSAEACCRMQIQRVSGWRGCPSWGGIGTTQLIFVEISANLSLREIAEFSAGSSR